MENVFDAVELLYDSENSPVEVLSRKDMEEYLRSKAWSGYDDDQLMLTYEEVFLMILYAEISFKDLGRFDKFDVIDMVAWMARNLPTFSTKEKSLSTHMDSWQDFYNFLDKKYHLPCPQAPAEAKKLLLPDGKLDIIDAEGNFKEGFEEYRDHATPDTDDPILVNFDNSYEELKRPLKVFFSQEQFATDYRFAMDYFDMILARGKEDLAPNTKGHEEVFWQYFLFDYHLIKEDITPIQYFCKNKLAQQLHWNERDCDGIEELENTRLRVFVVDRLYGDSVCRCHDLLTEEEFTTVIPVDDELGKKDWVMLGHLYSHDSRTMDYINSIYLPKSFRKKMLNLLEDLRNWVSGAWGHKPTWEEFVARYPMLLRHVLTIYSTYVMLEGFTFETKFRDYQPAPITEEIEKRFQEVLIPPLSTLDIPAYDLEKVKQMYTDFLAAYGEENVKSPTEHLLWALAVLEAYLAMNKLSKGGRKLVIGEFDLNTYVVKVAKVLQLEQFDPRYINEHGLILMTIAK